jgi:tetratricopeptide (TPR) repeat protein
VALASIRGDLGGADAEELYQAAADGFAARGDGRGEVLARVFLATHHQIGGRAAKAEAPLARAGAVAEATQDPLLVARVRVAEAWQAYRKGDHGRALTALEEVREVVLREAPPQLQSTWLSAKAIVSWALGRHAEAMELYQRQAQVLREAGDRYEEAVARGNMVFMAPILGIDRGQIRQMAEDLLAAATASGNRAMAARAHDYLAGLTSGAEAIEHARTFLSMSRAARRTPAITGALRRLAGLLAEEDAPDEARRLVDEAAVLARETNDLDEMARVEVVRSRIRWITGPRETAVTESLAALDAIEATRGRQPEALVRARRFSQWRQVYTSFAVNLLTGRWLPAGVAPSRADVELAFHVTERRRARLLLEDALRAGVGTAERTLTEPLPLASLPEVQAALAEDEALLAFHVIAQDPNPRTDGSEGCWLLVVTRERTRLHSVPDRTLSAIPLFVGLFERRDGTEAVPAAELGADLLERALGELPTARRLVIIPDSVLHTLPFDALHVRGAGLLGAGYEVSIVPSATLWLRLRLGGSAEVEAPALTLSDPEFASGSEASSERQGLRPDARLGRLPRARAEGRMIARRLGGDSRVVSGREASEPFLKQAALQRFALIHFAAHAVVDENQPERSALLLAPGAAEDGLLQLREIAALDLRRRLVVLSTCRSASGPLIGGEGLVSLAHGFFQAGARTVVGSLWPLRDDEAERLFDGFYRRLGQGHSVGQAMAGARRERMQAGAPAAAWAGMVVLGDGAAVPFPGGRPSHGSRDWVTGAMGMAAAAAVAALVVRSRGRRR